LDRMQQAGYTQTFDRPMTFGIVSLYKGTA
jgi:hypothetical protein